VPRTADVLSTYATLVCVLSDIKSAVIVSIFPSVRLQVLATVTPIGMKFCTLVDIGPGHKVSPFGEYPQGAQKSLNFDRESLENGKSPCYMSNWA